jgi:hypothetical protein
MRDLQKNSSELAGVQLEQISEGKLKTTLIVTYERVDNRRGTFKIINKGVSVAKDIKVKIDTSGSKFSHIDTQDFLTKDLTLFQCPDLDPDQSYPVPILWDSSDDRAEVEWNWINADNSSCSKQFTFNV